MSGEDCCQVHWVYPGTQETPGISRDSAQSSPCGEAGGDDPGGQTEVQVYTADTITYADLDPKAFMRPENRVLPTSDLKNNSKTAYAKINVSKSQLVWKIKPVAV